MSAIDVAELEENQVSEETLEQWCVEEQAMEVDIAALQQVEELERKVTSASLQVKVRSSQRNNQGHIFGKGGGPVPKFGTV